MSDRSGSGNRSRSSKTGRSGLSDDLIAMPMGDARNTAPVLAAAEPLHQFDQRPFALEADDGIGPGDSLQNLLGVEARIMSADGDVRSATRRAQGFDHSRKRGRHILEDQREPDHVGPEPFRQRHDRLGVGGVGLDAAGETRLPHRRQQVPQTEVILVLVSNQKNRGRGIRGQASLPWTAGALRSVFRRDPATWSCCRAVPSAACSVRLRETAAGSTLH